MPSSRQDKDKRAKRLAKNRKCKARARYAKQKQERQARAMGVPTFDTYINDLHEGEAA